MLWLLAGILAIGLGGGAALLVGLRGRRVDDHPICRRCGFDLIGQALRASEKGAGEGDVTTTDSPRCSECGADLTRRRAIRLGERRRRPAVATVGALALLISLGATGAISWGAATEYDWNTIKPVWLLARELQSIDPAVAQAATDELRRRLPGNGLAPMRNGQRDTRAAERLARSILDYQGDASRPWSPGAGEIFERMWQMKLLPEEMFHQYVRQSSPVSVHIRPRIAQGEPLAVRFDVQQRSGGGGVVSLHAALVDIAMDGKPIPTTSYRFSVQEGWPDAPWSMPLQPIVSFELLTPSDAVDSGFKLGRPHGIELPPGDWPVNLRLVVRREMRGPTARQWTRSVDRGLLFRLRPPGDSIADLAFYSGLWHGDDLPEGLPALEVIEVEREIEVAPAGASVVTAATGADAEVVAKRIIAQALLERSMSSGDLELRLTVDKDLPLDIAYDIALVTPDGDRPLRLLVHDVEATATRWRYHIPVDEPPGTEPGDLLRFTFTPNPRAAARLAGIEEIAGESFEVELIVPERILWGPPSPP